jgi:hypothetical protein
MADIDVVPRKRTNTWLWIILAIVAALVVFALINAGAPDRISLIDVPSPHSLSPTVTFLT